MRCNTGAHAGAGVPWSPGAGAGVGIPVTPAFSIKKENERNED